MIIFLKIIRYNGGSVVPLEENDESTYQSAVIGKMKILMNNGIRMKVNLEEAIPGKTDVFL